MNTTTSKSTEIVIARTFDTPRNHVWKAWTEPDQIEQWWGPRGFTTRVDELNFSPGGSFKYTMIDAGGAEYPAVGVFKEITSPERIVATDEFGDDMREAMPDLPTGMITTTTFHESGGRTRLTITIMHQSVEDRQTHEEMGVIDGFNEQLDKLGEYLNN